VYFAFSASLRIFDENLDPDEISRTIGLTPTHTHRKGEARSRHSPPWNHDMWIYAPPLDESRPLEEHIMALWEAVRPHMAYLRASSNATRWMSFAVTAATAGLRALKSVIVASACLPSWRSPSEFP